VVKEAIMDSQTEYVIYCNCAPKCK